LVLKAIHTDGERQAKEAGRCSIDGPVQIFPEPSTIPFRLLKTIRAWVDGLEVAKNKYWEWEDAICSGCKIFFQLRKYTQGTVHVDMNNREITFSPIVCPGISGITVGMGMGAAAENG
jgi:hypothetical protein